ncbi:MAG: tRNA (guanosine(46)-N7)-methyltransferase TrmB [Hyphomicrobiales bacterium]|nr:tRNA (guanosine(46)-N7)-methyltransferase TrmB [Hyphomicrobiales bacterium]
MGEDRPRRQAQGAVLKGLYGRRKGKKLRDHHASLMAELLPRLAVDVTRGALDPVALFSGAASALHLEIGFGGGERLIARAAAAREAGFIGCEPFVNGMAKALAGAEEHELTNLRLHNGDARDLLRTLPDACLDSAELLYPDPWPKRRQKKRRIVSDAFIAELARVLKPGAPWRFASDIDDYVGWTLAHVARSRDFVWRAECPADFLDAYPDWAPTRYEEKARREGRTSAYLTFVRT